ncbi:MAG: SPOR domain-containing protein [Acidocella sp.]|nr:SPOR domain-containing protein [Acidocella sp.]
MQDPDDDFLYQPQRERGERLDPALRRMALGAGGVTLLVVVVALGWSGIHTGGFGPPPVINAPDVPLRVAPQSPGGLEVPGADVPIMSGQMAPQGAPQLAPTSQAPAVAELNQAAGLNQPPPQPVPAQPASAQPAPQAASPATPAPAAQAAAPAPASSPAKPSAPADVQLAATPDEPSAAATWASLQRKYPDLLGNRKPVIIPAVVNGKSVWRLRVSGFANADEAKSFCAQLAAKGGKCAVAAF